MQKTATNLKKVGASLTKFVTLPLVGLGAAALKSAADFEVASRKFAGAFAGAEKEANAAVTNLNENFGIATSQATELLAFTGDLLKGFGATSVEALNLAENTNELAAALAAYNGVPVAQASEAITKALLGERESLKLLGVAIRETDVQQQLLLEGKENLTGQALLLAKAEATLKLATNQSSDAVSNFASNTDTLAFQTQALVADLKDLAVQFGTILIPIAKQVVAEIRKVAEWFGNLDEQQRENIIKLAALAAAIGPVISVVGQLTTAVRLLSTAFSGPAGIAVAIGAATIALAAWAKAKRDAKVEELSEDIDNVTRETADLTGALYDLEEANFAVGRAFKNWAQEQALFTDELDTSMATIDTILRQIEQNYGVARDEAILLAATNREVPEAFREVLAPMAQQIKLAREAKIEEQQMLELRREGRNYLQGQAEAAEAVADAESTTTEELTAQAELRKAIEDKYIAARANVLAILKQEQTEIQNIQDQIDALEETPWASGQLENDRLAAIQLLKDRQKEIIDEQTQAEIAAEQAKIDEINAINEENATRLLNLNASRLTQLEVAKAEELANAEAIGADKFAITSYYDQLIAAERERLAEEERQRQIETFTSIANAASNFVSNLGGLFNQYYSNQLGYIENDKNAQIEALGEKGLSDEEYAKEKEKIEKESAKKEYEIKLKSWKTQKALDTTQTVISTALAAMRAYSSLASIPIVGPILGAIAAAAAIAFGAVQIGLINSQPPPPKPAFADGGIVQGAPGTGIDAIVGEAGPEAILPLNSSTLGALGDAIAGSTEGTTSPINSGNAIRNVIVLDGEVIADNTTNRINDRQNLVNTASIVA